MTLNGDDWTTVQGLVFNGTIKSEFNVKLDFVIENLKITGYVVYGIILKDIFFTNNSFSNAYFDISVNSLLYISDISIFLTSVGYAIFFQNDSIIMFRENYDSGFLYFYLQSGDIVFLLRLLIKDRISQLKL